MICTLCMVNLFTFGPQAYASAITMGTAAVLSDSDSNTGNYLMALKCTLSQTATLQSISANIKANPNGKKMSMAIYDNASGMPGTKRAETAQFVPTAGWNTQDVLSQVQLTAGTYWIAWYGEDASLTYGYQTSGGTLYYNDFQTFGVFPSAFPSGSSLGYNYSLYATFETAGPPPDTQSIEAESGTLSNGAAIVNDANASGGQSIGNLHNSNASCQVGNVNGGTGGTATVVITYSSNDTGASKGLFVNGTKVATLNFSNTGGWNSYTTLTTTVTLNAGTGNTIMIKNDAANGWGINFDKLAITPAGASSTPAPTPTPTPTPGIQSIEAESGTLANGATIMSTSNASGGQSVGNLHNSSASCQVGNVSGGAGGTATLVVTYASNDTGASKGLFVNGTRTTLNFSNTGGWNTFSTVTATISLNSGTGNTIMIRNDEANSWGINLDKFTITMGGATPTPTPTGSPSDSKLTWTPPPMAADTITYNVSGSGTYEVNPAWKDAIIVLPPSTFTGQIHIKNAHNVRMIGGEIQIRANVDGDDRAIYIDEGCNGTIFIEGIHIIAGSGHEGDAMAINAPAAVVVFQNCRIDNLVGAKIGHTHSDVCQPWGGVSQLKADRITASSSYQGFFVRRDRGDIGGVTLKNINITGQIGLDSSGGYYLWTDETGSGGDSVYLLTIQNFWISPRPGRTLGDSVSPTINPTQDLSSVAWNTPNRVGTVNKGVPPGGDFVPSGVSGINYVSPGYN